MRLQSAPGVVDVRCGDPQLLGQVGDEPDDLREQSLRVAGQRLELSALFDHVRHLLELADEVRLLRHGSREPDAMNALDEDPQRAVGNAEQLVDDRGRADRVEVVPERHLDVGVADGEQPEQAVAADDVVDQPDRALLPDRERRHRVREDDRLLERQDRQLRGKRRFLGASTGTTLRPAAAVDRSGSLIRRIHLEGPAPAVRPRLRPSRVRATTPAGSLDADGECSTTTCARAGRRCGGRRTGAGSRGASLSSAAPASAPRTAPGSRPVGRRRGDAVRPSPTTYPVVQRATHPDDPPPRRRRPRRPPLRLVRGRPQPAAGPPPQGSPPPLASEP